MEESGDIAVPDGSQSNSSHSPAPAVLEEPIVPTELTKQPEEPLARCNPNIDERFFAYRVPKTPDICSEFSEATLEDNSSCCTSVAGSSVSTLYRFKGKERRQLNKIRKARQLKRYRKWLMPKNAIAALNEMKDVRITELTVNTVGHQTKVSLLINNVRYEETARNKQVAQHQLYERALRDLIIARLANSASQDVPNNGAEDLPMEHLASFAIHKLLAQWERDGYELPIFATSSGTKHHQPSPRKPTGQANAVLPSNASSYHPSMLVVYMRPQTSFDDLGWNGDLLNPEFTAGLVLDGHYFIGKGRSKKLARKAAAINACNVLFGVVFDGSVQHLCDQFSESELSTDSV